MIQRTLCQAIKSRNWVKITQYDDLTSRTFEPYIVYESSTGKTLVGGVQIKNPVKPEDDRTYHNFDLAKVRLVTLTDTKFAVPFDFNPSDPRYKRVFCHVKQYSL